MTQIVQLFPVAHYAQLILSNKGIFVKEILIPGFPEYYFRVLENPKDNEAFLAISEEEVRYSCGEHKDEECYCQNKSDFKKLLKSLDQMRSKQSIPMEGKIVERQALEI